MFIFLPSLFVKYCGMKHLGITAHLDSFNIINIDFGGHQEILLAMMPCVYFPICYMILLCEISRFDPGFWTVLPSCALLPRPSLWVSESRSRHRLRPWPSPPAAAWHLWHQLHRTVESRVIYMGISCGIYDDIWDAAGIRHNNTW